MANRVLHYLLGLTDPTETRAFHRVLAAPEDAKKFKDLLKKIPDSKEAQKIADLIEKRGKQQDGSFWQKLLHGPLKKGTLDMTAEELDRVLKTPRGNPSKFDFYLLEYFRPDQLPEKSQVEKAIFEAKRDHSLEIDELSYDPGTTELRFEGDNGVAKKLLEGIGFQDSSKVLEKELWYAKHRIRRLEDDAAVLKFSIPVDRLGTLDLPIAEEKVQEWLQAEGLSEKTAVVSDAQKAILFTGKVGHLKQLIYSLRLEPAAQADVLKNLANFLVK